MKMYLLAILSFINQTTRAQSIADSSSPFSFIHDGFKATTPSYFEIHITGKIFFEGIIIGQIITKRFFRQKLKKILIITTLNNH